MEIKRFSQLIVVLLVVSVLVSGITPQDSFNFRDYYNLSGVGKLNTTLSCLGSICISSWGQVNVTTADIWVDEAGDTMSGDLNMSGNKLTDLGELVMSGVVRSMNVTPLTSNLYSLGNKTRWWKEAYITTLFAGSINASTINASLLNSSEIDSGMVNVDDNISIGGHVVKKENTNLVMILK
jgi:hypothetical protein